MDRETWLELRKPYITSSGAFTVLGLNPRKSVYTYWQELRGNLEADDEENLAIELGNELEPFVARRYSKETGRELRDLGRYTLLTCEEFPWAAATIDREIHGVDGRGPGVLEIKTTAGWAEGFWEDEPPEAALVQLQHQLAVTGCQWGSIAGLIMGFRTKFKYQDIERNERFIGNLMEIEEAFLDSVKRDRRPDPDGSESTTKALKDLYPKDDYPDPINVPGIAEDWIHDIWDLKKAEEKNLDAQDEIKNRIRELMGNAAVGVTPNGLKISYRTQTKPAHMMPAWEGRVLLLPRAKKETSK